MPGPPTGTSSTNLVGKLTAVRTALDGAKSQKDDDRMNDCFPLVWVAVYNVLELDPELRRPLATQPQFIENVNRLGVGRFRDLLRNAKEENGTWKELFQDEVFFAPKEDTRPLGPSMTHLHLADQCKHPLRPHVEDGLVSQGELGELTGRLLLILAMDSAQEVAQSGEIARGIRPRWSKPVGVIDFMKALFGNENYNEHIRNCVPDNGSGEAFDDQFKNSVVRFTHFARADDDSGVTTGAALAAFVRRLAVQCHPYQQSADVAMAMLLDKNKPVVEENMSIMSISFKNKSRASNINDTAVDADQLGCFPESDLTDFEEQDRGIRPYINLVMELGIQPKTPFPSAAPKNYPQTTAGTLKRSNGVESAATRKKAKTVPFARHATIDSNLQALRRSARIRTKQPVHPRYLIRVRGCSPSVYSVVHNKDVYADLLHARPIFTEHSRPEEFVAAVRRLRGPDGRGHWIKMGINTAKNDEADVTADTIEVGKAPEEDLESEDNGD